MEKMNFDQMENVKGGDRYDLACNLTVSLFAGCVGTILAPFTGGGSFIVSVGVGGLMSYAIC